MIKKRRPIGRGGRKSTLRVYDDLKTIGAERKREVLRWYKKLFSEKP